MTDIEPAPIIQEPTRLEDEFRFFETYHKSSWSVNYSFSELIKCNLYDSTTQTTSTGLYTFPNFTQTGWFTYVSWVLTVPKDWYYYTTMNLEVNWWWSSGWASYTLTTWIWLDITMWRPWFVSANYKENRSNIIQLTKGQTISFTYTQSNTSTMKWNLTIYEINPLALIIK